MHHLEPISHAIRILGFALAGAFCPLTAYAMDPTPALTWSGTGDEIAAYSMAIASDGRIYVAAEVDGPLGQIIRFRRSDDSGETWYDWGEIAASDGNEFANPSLHIAEGDENRVFLVMKCANS